MSVRLPAYCPHAATRRQLLLGSGALFAWAFVPKIARAEGRDPRFLTIVLRGALDGLAAVAPVGDPDWTKLRGDNALKLDGDTPALPLDGFFALNPAMPNLYRLYKAGQATIVHAAATPYRERSHFDGQDLLESGLAGPARLAAHPCLGRRCAAGHRGRRGRGTAHRDKTQSAATPTARQDRQAPQRPPRVCRQAPATAGSKPLSYRTSDDPRDRGSYSRRVTYDGQRNAKTRNAAQYCRLVMRFCDATVASRDLFPKIKIFAAE